VSCVCWVWGWVIDIVLFLAVSFLSVSVEGFSRL
jgi:hypothetical protein